jgi:hypothetical protein
MGTLKSCGFWFPPSHAMREKDEHSKTTRNRENYSPCIILQALYELAQVSAQ